MQQILRRLEEHQPAFQVIQPPISARHLALGVVQIVLEMFLGILGLLAQTCDGVFQF